MLDKRHMTSDFLYENPPLVEVIAELHWQLRPVSSAPDAKIDPLFDIFQEAFLEAVKKDGLVEIERLVPSEIPVEFVPSQPHLRLRSKPGTWPLVQIGPGVLTANIVPPYDGWAEFSTFLQRMVDVLFETYPLPQKALRINRLHLRYIDGFSKGHGFTDFFSFTQEMLGLAPTLNTDFIRETVQSEDSISFTLENRFSNKSPQGSQGRTKILPAKVGGVDAAVLELHCEQQFDDRSATDANRINEWFDASHQTLRAQFGLITTPELKKTFGNKKEIN